MTPNCTTTSIEPLRIWKRSRPISVPAAGARANLSGTVPFMSKPGAAVASLRQWVEKKNKVAVDVKVNSADLNQGKGTAGKLLKDDKLYEDTRVAIAKFDSTASRIDAI